MWNRLDIQGSARLELPQKLWFSWTLARNCLWSTCWSHLGRFHSWYPNRTCKSWQTLAFWWLQTSSSFPFLCSPKKWSSRTNPMKIQDRHTMASQSWTERHFLWISRSRRRWSSFCFWGRSHSGRKQRCRHKGLLEDRKGVRFQSSWWICFASIVSLSAN